MFSIELVEKNTYQIFIIHYISLRDLIYYVQYWTCGEEYISDFLYSLHFFKRFLYIIFSIELLEKNTYQIFIIHYISLRDLICYVQYWTRGEDTYQIFIMHYISLRDLICCVQYWTRGEEYIIDFHYSLHFFEIYEFGYACAVLNCWTWVCFRITSFIIVL
jgi:hypothetical protein